ncbi:MAG TPA: hypothetical protein VFQ85_08295 [Mycobacteriales bacterium]|jgi:hypothetical protein|nr:hypothetical protein [Mycobacteriales bacterium]
MNYGDTIVVDQATALAVRFAARLHGITDSQVVIRAVAQIGARGSGPAHRWEPVPVFCEYAGVRVDGTYLPATRRLVVNPGESTERSFRSPSGAARAVVEMLNPRRSHTQTNGWHFWRIADSGARLDTVRYMPPNATAAKHSNTMADST